MTRHRIAFFPGCRMSTAWLMALQLVGMNSAAQADDPPAPVRVFILAGQSNMEGQAVIDLDHPQYYNGGAGTLERVIEDSEMDAYAHLRQAGGEWAVREDVWFRFRTARGLVAGPLTVGGTTAYLDGHHFGPELQLGHVVGDRYDEQVMLIKTAWGGKSLHRDFRPPSAAGETGPYYVQMLEEVREALARMPEEFPDYEGQGYELSAFVWFQGWNDMIQEEARDEYRQNLVHLVHDVRSDLQVPGLPVVIGELGQGGAEAGANILAIRRAQAAAAAEIDGAVFVETHAFHRPAAESPNVGHGHHWFGNAESYFLIGDALGRAIIQRP